MPVDRLKRQPRLMRREPARKELACEFRPGQSMDVQLGRCHSRDYTVKERGFKSGLKKHGVAWYPSHLRFTDIIAGQFVDRYFDFYGIASYGFAGSAGGVAGAGGNGPLGVASAFKSPSAYWMPERKNLTVIGFMYVSSRCPKSV